MKSALQNNVHRVHQGFGAQQSLEIIPLEPARSLCMSPDWKNEVTHLGSSQIERSRRTHWVGTPSSLRDARIFLNVLWKLHNDTIGTTPLTSLKFIILGYYVEHHNNNKYYETCENKGLIIHRGWVSSPGLGIKFTLTYDGFLKSPWN